MYAVVFFQMLGNVYVSSIQGEFHPEPLTEPYVIVSHHTALLIQIYALNLNIQHASGKTDLESVSQPCPTIYRRSRVLLPKLKKTA